MSALLAVPIHVASTDPVGKVLYVSGEWHRMSIYTTPQQSVLHASDFVFPDDRIEALANQTCEIIIALYNGVFLKKECSKKLSCEPLVIAAPSTNAVDKSFLAFLKAILSREPDQTSRYFTLARSEESDIQEAVVKLQSGRVWLAPLFVHKPQSHTILRLIPIRPDGGVAEKYIQNLNLNDLSIDTKGRNNDISPGLYAVEILGPGYTPLPPAVPLVILRGTEFSVATKRLEWLRRNVTDLPDEVKHSILERAMYTLAYER